MSEQIADPSIRAYLNTHHLLVHAVTGWSTEQLRWKAASESWSGLEVLSHLVDHHLIVSFRIRAVLAETRDRLPAFEQDLWVSSQRANEEDAGEVLAVFQSLLHYNGLLLNRLTDSDWEKSGISASGSSIRVIDIVNAFTDHVYRHLQQLERIKQAQERAQTQAGLD